MPLRTEAICDRRGQHESFGEKQSFPETPPPGLVRPEVDVTRRRDVCVRVGIAVQRVLRRLAGVAERL